MTEFLDNPRYTSPQDAPRPYNRQLLIDFFDSFENFEEFENLGKFEELLFIAGIGSGKSFISSMAMAYILHRLLCLRDPQSYFKFAKNTRIAFVNISTSFSQAKDVVFGELKNRIDNNSWFQEFFAPDPRIKSLIRMPKNIYVLPVGSNEEAPLGYNIFGAVIDEASFHTATKDKDYAEESYNQIKKRIRSRYLNKGKLLTITSPRFVHDFAENKFEADKENPRVMRRRAALWDVMPEERYEGPKFDVSKYLSKYKEEKIMVPIEFEEEFKQNPERAMRDYGARASMAIEGFFNNPEIIPTKANKDRSHPWSNELNDFHEWFWNYKSSKDYDSDRRFIHVDLALNKDGKGDAAGIAMGKFDGWVQSRSVNGGLEKRPKIKIDFVKRITAGPKEEIMFEDVRKMIYRLSDIGYNIHLVTFDGWQSIDSIQTLNSAGFNAELFSVDRNPEAYHTLKSAILDDRLDFYYYQPFVTEMQQLEELKGKKIDHPRGGSKDCSDAVAGVVYHAAKGTPGFGFKIIGER